MSGYDDGPWDPPGGSEDAWRPRSRAGGRLGDSAGAGRPGGFAPFPGDLDDLGRTAVDGRRGPGPGVRTPGEGYRAPDKRTGKSAGKAPGKAPGQRKKWGWKKKTLVWTSAATAFLILSAGGVAGYLYLHFNANLKSTPLLPAGVTQAAEVPNQFGQTPLNLLVMGSDSRDSAEDCALGHDCQGSDNYAAGQRADVEMVVHLSADRTNMTVMSIPRDTVARLPTCAGGGTNLINAALNGGPSCQVEEVHELTGLTIDGYVMADMAAVVGLSNAIGPVDVCVTNNVYDKYSGLKLPKGTTPIVGDQALEWLRSRHAFLNEPQREQAQHLYLSAMIRKLESEGSLTNVGLLYSVADVATKSLTVSSNLDSVTKLLSLAQQMGKVPASRITMLDMPWEPYAGPDSDFAQQLQVAQPQASHMFAALQADQPYTAATPAGAASVPASGAAATAAPAAPTGAPVDDAAVRVSVVNDSGVSGRAQAVRDGLVGAGFTEATGTTGDGAAQTAVYYPSGRSDSAAAVAAALNIPAAQVHESKSYSQVTVLVGKDWTTGTTYGAAPAAGTGGPAAQASAPPAESMENFVSDANACMTVSSPEW
ncbi:MAG TPA: LCP family protein [Actinocrinis sp.]|nr:LCP family protein [Actinocrinis sp.]